MIIIRLVMLLLTAVLIACDSSRDQSNNIDSFTTTSNASTAEDEIGIINSDSTELFVESGFVGEELNTDINVENIASVDGITPENELLLTYEFDNETRITYTEYSSGGFKEFLITNPGQSDIILYVDASGAPTNAVIGDTTIEYSVENSILIGATLNDDIGNEFRYVVVDGQFSLVNEVAESKKLGSLSRVSQSRISQSCPANDNLKRRFCDTVRSVTFRNIGIAAIFSTVVGGPIVTVPLLFASLICLVQAIEPDLPPSPVSTTPVLCGDPPDPEPEPEPEPTESGPETTPENTDPLNNDPDPEVVGIYGCDLSKPWHISVETPDGIYDGSTSGSTSDQVHDLIWDVAADTGESKNVTVTIDMSLNYNETGAGGRVSSRDGAIWINASLMPEYSYSVEREDSGKLTALYTGRGTNHGSNVNTEYRRDYPLWKTEAELRHGVDLRAVPIVPPAPPPYYFTKAFPATSGIAHYNSWNHCRPTRVFKSSHSLLANHTLAHGETTAEAKIVLKLKANKIEPYIPPSN